MADERIPGLPATAEDIKAFAFIMDKTGEVSAVQVPYGDVLGAIETAITALQADKADKADVILKGTVSPFTPSQPGDPADVTFVNKGGGQIAWQNATKVSGQLGANAFMRCCAIGPWNVVTGIQTMTSIPAEGTVLYTLPAIFPTFTETFYFSANDGNSEETYEMKALAGTRNIVQGSGGSTGSQAYFGVSIPVI